MLSTEQIAERIKNPYLCDLNELDFLKELSIKHSYSQVFSILYLKALSIHKSISFEEELLNHAYKITDRAQLYHLIKQNKVLEDNEIVLQENNDIHLDINTITLDEVIETNNDLVLKNEISQNSTDEIEISDLHDSSQEINENIEDEEVSLIEINEEVSTQEEANHSDVSSSDIEYKAFEKEIIASAIAGSYLSHIEKSVVNNVKEIIENDTISEIPENISSTHTFTNWLSQNKNAEKNIETDRIIIQQIVNDSDDEKGLNQEHSEKKSKQATDKKEFYSATKKAKESIESSSIPVSETLAKIFALQGNFPSAIEVYEQLILHFPEKKTFFASQIEELTKKLNITKL